MRRVRHYLGILALPGFLLCSLPLPAAASAPSLEMYQGLTEGQRLRLWRSPYFELPAGASKEDSLRALGLWRGPEARDELLIVVLARVDSISNPPLASYPFADAVPGMLRETIMYTTGLSRVSFSVLDRLRGDCPAAFDAVYFGETGLTPVVWTDEKPSPLIVTGSVLLAALEPSFRGSTMPMLRRTSLFSLGVPNTADWRPALLAPTRSLYADFCSRLDRARNRERAQPNR
jgi:hypothetical protein